MNRFAIRAPLALALSFAFAGPALADDPRLVEKFYDAGEIYTVHGRTGVQTTIRFAEDEAIENVAIGDSAKWQVTPNKRANLLFVKPLADRAATNMTVVTNARTYLFDLVASPNTKPLYILPFEYPAEPEEVQLADEQEGDGLNGPTPTELAAATDPFAVLDPTAINFSWESAGDRALLPTRIYDDGSATFLYWPSGVAMPVILVKDPEGTEGPVNFAVRGDTIVLDMVPHEIVLRSGEDEATLVNRAPRPTASGSAGA